jgi:hypothetical protein
LLVALVEALREGDHDVALLQQELLVPLHLRFLFLDALALLLQLLQTTFVPVAVARDSRLKRHSREGANRPSA